MLPVFAPALTPAGYGQIAVLVTLQSLTTIVFGLGLDAAMFRVASRRGDPVARHRDLCALTTFIMVGPLVIAGLLAGLALLVPAPTGLGSVDLALALGTTGVITAGTVAPMALLRAGERLGAFTVLVLVPTVAQVVLRTIFVVGLMAGVRGWLIVDLVVAIATLILSLRWQGSLLTTRPHLTALRSALRLALPLLPHALAHWGLGLSDRLVLLVFITPAAVGLYSMGYQVGVLVLLVVTELSRSLMPRFVEAASSAPAEPGPGELGRYVRLQVLTCAGVAALAAMCGPQALLVLLPDDYHPAAGYVPLVVLGALFVGLYYVPMNMLVFVAGDTSRIWRLSLAAGASNVGLNFLLVPRIGAMAAALDTAIAYFLLLVLVGIRARRRCPRVELGLRSVTPTLAILTVVAVPASMLAVRPDLLGMSAAAVGSLLCAAATATALIRTAGRRPGEVSCGLPI